MTNSSVKKEPTGPFRVGALAPAIVFFVLTALYFKFFFDGHLKKAIEFGATAAHGAEVDVTSVHTSFLNASFELNGLQITDSNQPSRDLFQVGTIKFKALWDGLLRGKVVIDEASILDIQALVPRKTPGYVKPLETKTKSDKPGVVDQVQTEALDQTQKQLSGNIFGDLAGLLNGVDPKDQLKNLEGELKSSKMVKQLQVELSEKEKAWKERLKSLPQTKEIEEIGKRVKTLKFDTKNPIEFAKSLQEAQKIFTEADQKIKLVSETGKDINQDINKYTQAFKELEAATQNDLNDIQAKLKIPNVNGSDFTKNLFMGLLMKKLGSMKKYLDTAEKYMPAKSTDKAEKAAKVVHPEQRRNGKSYRFPITVGYPLFWLKHAAISSEVSQSAEYSGNIKGEIKDLTSDPKYLQKPAIITINGDFPQQSISGLEFKLKLDHTKEVAQESLLLKVASYPVSEQNLVSSDDVKLSFRSATGGLELNSVFNSDNIDVKMINAFTKVDYDIQSKNEIVKDILTKVLTQIPVVDFNAQAKGPWSNLDFNLNSNLGDELSKGFKQQVQARIDEAKAKVKALIDDKIGAEKQKLTAEFDKIKGEVGGEVTKSQSEIEKVKKSAQADVDKQKNQGGVKKLEEEGKKLLKQFKFGG